LSANFWRRFAESTTSSPIKIAPFNRYPPSTSCAAVSAPARSTRRALSGNDDTSCRPHSAFDLRDNGVTTARIFRGGLLGHWSVWTAAPSNNSEIARRARQGHSAIRSAGARRPVTIQQRFFDVAHNFHGCIAGCHEICGGRGCLRESGVSILPKASARSDAGDRPVCNEQCGPRCRRFRCRALAEMAGMREALLRCATSARSTVARRGFLAVSDVTMDVSEGRIDLAGRPARCGKTTVLKIPAGLHDADGGTIEIGNARTPFVPARHRHGVPAGAAADKWRTHPRQRAIACGIVGLPTRPPAPAPAIFSIWSDLPATRDKYRSNCQAACSSARDRARLHPRSETDPDGRAVRPRWTP